MSVQSPSRDDLAARIGRMAIRIGAILILVYGVKLGIDYLFAKFEVFETDAGARAMIGLLITIMVGYALLLAIPFVPGVEIGAAILLIEGAEAAPLVYGATVLGLFIAFCIGQYAPIPRLIALCQDMSLHRIARLLRSIDIIPQNRRIGALQERLPNWLAPVVCNYRYVTLGLAINIPGNIAVGGGGGIMMAGGLSRLFHTGWTFLTIAIATLPVPLAVWVFGTDILQ